MNNEQKLEQFNDILQAMGLPRVDIKGKPTTPEQVKPVKFEFRPEGQRVERTKQDIALDAVRGGKFIIGSVDSFGNLSFSANPMLHDTAQSARSECARLARCNTGKAFVFVKLTGAELVPTSSVSI